MPCIPFPTRSCLLLAVLAAGGAAAEDGVYETAADGGLGKRVALTVTRGHILSQSNANDRWSAFVCFPQAGFLEGDRYTVVLAGKARRINGWGKSGDREYDFGLLLDAAEVEPARALFGLPVLPRHHPGYRIDGAFSTAKAVYEPGEKISVTLVIRNVGDQPFFFQRGGRQRGPRDDQFVFAGEGPDGSLEIKQAFDFGGMSVIQPIPAHGELSLDVDLGGWIDARKPGTYQLTASYLLPVHEDDASAFAVWEDWLTRPFSFEVRIKPAE
jgi:hypothetical protein